MTNQLKSAALTMTMVFGLAGVAQASQQPSQPVPRPVPQSAQPMTPQMMGEPGQDSMMNNPEMRQRMAAMMERCQRMMSRMGAQQGAMPVMQDRQ